MNSMKKIKEKALIIHKDFKKNIQPKIKKTSIVVFEKAKKIVKKRSFLPIVVGLILFILLILVVVDWFSPKSIIGIQQKKHRYPDIGTRSDIVYSKFKTESLGKKTETFQKNGKILSLEYPVTGDKNFDISIEKEIKKFANSIPLLSVSTTYSSQAYTFADYVFVTLFQVKKEVDLPVFKTFGISKNGTVSLSDFLAGEEANQIIINTIKTKLSESFAVPNEKSEALAISALKNGSWRMASNGIVVVLPAYDLNVDSLSGPYYEVLVPSNLIYTFIK